VVLWRDKDISTTGGGRKGKPRISRIFTDLLFDEQRIFTDCVSYWAGVSCSVRLYLAPVWGEIGISRLRGVGIGEDH